MNQIRAIQALNKREIENGVPPEASWHVDYRDTAYIYFGGLPYELSEGDVITIFSQFGEPVFLKMLRDQETGKSKGFGWLKYEDQRSTDLAVDNLGGAEIGGRLIRVDHARYKVRDDDDPEEGKVGWEDLAKREASQRDESPVESSRRIEDDSGGDRRRRRRDRGDHDDDRKRDRERRRRRRDPEESDGRSRKERRRSRSRRSRSRSPRRH